MLPSEEIAIFLEELTLHNERSRLIGLCTRLTGDRQAAEDLVQETLLEAWRQRYKLRDPASGQRWLNAIARNICLRWARERQIQFTHLVSSLEQTREQEEPGWEEQLAADFDVEVELERDELAQLLDRALALLPPVTRTILIQRYIHDAANAEIAARLKVSEDVIAQRIHRGKLKLHNVLTRQFHQDIAAYGFSVTADDWQETRIWCTMCGMQRLHACWGEHRTALLMRCPTCNSPGAYYLWNDGRLNPTLFAGIKGFKAGLMRVFKLDAQQIRPGMRTVICPACGKDALVRQGAGEDLPPMFSRGGPNAHSYAVCPNCGVIRHFGLCDRLLELPEGLHFWRAHPRFCTLPDREIETAGGPALVTSFQSLTDAARLDFVTAHDVFEIISIHTTATGHTEGHQ